MIQKLYATPWVIAISVRAPGKTYWIYQGRGQGWEGIWLQETQPPSAWRVVDRLIEFYRKRLSASSLVDIRLDPLDRLVHMDYQKWGATNTLSYYWQGRLAYLGCCYFDPDKQAFKIFLSWDQHSEICKQTYEDDSVAKRVYENAFAVLGLEKMSKNDEAPRPPQTDIWDVLVKAHVNNTEANSIKKDTKSRDRKMELFKKDLARVEQIHQIKQYLSSGQPIGEQLKIGDHSFKFKSEQTEHQRRDLIFQKIKRLQMAAKIIQEKMNELSTKKETVKSQKKVNTVGVKSVFPVMKLKEEATQAKAVSVPLSDKDKEYKIFEGKLFSLGVGMSARGNDLLRKEWAKKEDLWFHAASGKSAHVILKWKKDTGVISSEMIQMAGSCLLEHQKNSLPSEIDLIYTKVAQLKGVKGSAGMVTYKGEKHLKIRFNKNWREEI